jgi:hypothetical protein
MARTPFEKANFDFSQVAHKAARRLLYPRMFPRCQLKYCCCDVAEENTFHYDLDKKMGIDKVILVRAPHFKEFTPLTVQERFRTMDDYRYREVTITEWNHLSDRASEFYKLYAHYFVYGYYDKEANMFAEAIVLNVAALNTYLLTLPRLKRQTNKKGQAFVCLPIDLLLSQNGVVFYHERNDDPEWFDESDPFAEHVGDYIPFPDLDRGTHR